MHNKFLTIINFRTDVPHVHSNVGRTGFRYFAPFEWKTLQTVCKPESFFPVLDFNVLSSEIFEMILF